MLLRLVRTAPSSEITGAPVLRRGVANRVAGARLRGCLLRGRSTRRSLMPGQTLTRKLIDAHFVERDPTAGEEIALRIDQTLPQEATGTLVMQELEAIGLDRAGTDVSAQYVDHNLLQDDERNAEDHEF